MKKYRKTGLLLGVIGTAALAIAFVAIPRAMAAPAHGYWITYFAEEDHINWVGEKVLTCEGHSVLNGQVTAFYEREDFDCF